jgi:hypothetical protein
VSLGKELDVRGIVVGLTRMLDILLLPLNIYFQTDSDPHQGLYSVVSELTFLLDKMAVEA